MKIFTTSLFLFFSIYVHSQCSVPIIFDAYCDLNNRAGTVTTSLGESVFTRYWNGKATAIIEGSFSSPVQWTFFSHSCDTVHGEIVPCNSYLNKDIIEHFVNCDITSTQNAVVNVNSDIRALDKVSSSALYTNMSTSQNVAGNSVCLEAGFETELYSSYHAMIYDCSSPIDYTLECFTDAWPLASIGLGGINTNFNIGRGYGISQSSNTHIDSFEIFLAGGFRSYMTDLPYNGDVELKLNIRDGQSSLMTSKTITVNAAFSGGWLAFDLTDLDVLLLGDRLYIFTWHVIDGDSLGVWAPQRSKFRPYTGSTFCNNIVFEGRSSEPAGTTMDDWAQWSSTSVNLPSIRINGHY